MIHLIVIMTVLAFTHMFCFAIMFCKEPNKNMQDIDFYIYKVKLNYHKQ